MIRSNFVSKVIKQGNMKEICLRQGRITLEYVEIGGDDLSADSSERRSWLSDELRTVFQAEETVWKVVWQVLGSESQCG